MVSSELEVAVEPGTAFAAFTEELDLWWVRGPINHRPPPAVTRLWDGWREWLGVRPDPVRCPRACGRIG